jgi:hypothetical protein
MPAPADLEADVAQRVKAFLHGAPAVLEQLATGPAPQSPRLVNGRLNIRLDSSGDRTEILVK